MGTKNIREVLPTLLPIILPEVLPTEPPTTWIPILKGDAGDRGPQGIQGPAGSDASVTKANVEEVLIGEITTHSHPGGSGGLTQQQIEGLL